MEMDGQRGRRAVGLLAVGRREAVVGDEVILQGLRGEVVPVGQVVGGAGNDGDELGDVLAAVERKFRDGGDEVGHVVEQDPAFRPFGDAGHAVNDVGMLLAAADAGAGGDGAVGALAGGNHGEALPRQAVVAETAEVAEILDTIVADPKQAVALDAVLVVVLHAEQGGVAADVPDPVQPLVGAGERALTGHGGVPVRNSQIFDAQAACGLRRDLEVAEGAAPMRAKFASAARGFEDVLLQGVEMDAGRLAAPRLVGMLAVGQAQFGGAVRHQLQVEPAHHLTPEVEQQLTMPFDAGSALNPQQTLGIGKAIALHHPLGAAFGGGHGDFKHARRVVGGEGEFLVRHIHGFLALVALNGSMDTGNPALDNAIVMKGMNVPGRADAAPRQPISARASAWRGRRCPAWASAGRGRQAWFRRPRRRSRRTAPVLPGSSPASGSTTTCTAGRVDGG